MSLKQEIETWVKALSHYDANEFAESLKEFDLIADTSKIFFNIGVIHATLGEHEKAVEAYQRAVKLDLYFAVAYFQQGVSNFLLGDFEEALANFNDSLLYLRGNTLIDYDQLGLKFRLYSCEVLFNRGLCYMYLQQEEAGMQDFSYAVKEKQVEDHNVIDEAIRENAEGYTVFSIPVGVVYRPNEAKVRNVKTKDYLGKARLVAASDSSNAFTGFAGSENKQRAEGTATTDDRNETDLSYAAMNLVIPGKTSKRTDSVPPGQTGPEASRVFPPTPPPERDTAQARVRESPASGRMPSRSNSAGPGVTRTASNTRPPVAAPRPSERRERRRDDIVEEGENGGRYGGALSPPRRPTGARSETSSSRGYAKPGSVRRAPTNSNSNRRRPDQYTEEPEEEENFDDFYDYYGAEPRNTGSRRSSGGRRQGSRRQASYDDDYQSEGDEETEYDDEFEMLGSRRGGTKRAPEIKKIKVKIHGEDTRMILISTTVQFDEFMVRLKEKMGFKRSCKCKVKDDDGEMIVIADQEDLDMVISNSKKNAKRSKSEMGKLEMWVKEG